MYPGLRTYGVSVLLRSRGMPKALYSQVPLRFTWAMGQLLDASKVPDLMLSTQGKPYLAFQNLPEFTTLWLFKWDILELSHGFGGFFSPKPGKTESCICLHLTEKQFPRLPRWWQIWRILNPSFNLFCDGTELFPTWVKDALF